VCDICVLDKMAREF